MESVQYMFHAVKFNEASEVCPAVKIVIRKFVIVLPEKFDISE